MNHTARSFLGQFAGVLLLPLIAAPTIAQTTDSPQPVTPVAYLIRPQRETILYPSAASSVTIPDPQSSATVTLNIGRREDGILLNLSAASLPADRCALVSIQTPPEGATGNEQAQLVTTPVSFVPLATQPGFCGTVSTAQLNPVSQPTLSYEALIRSPFLLDGKVQVPFTVEVFFVRLSKQ